MARLWSGFRITLRTRDAAVFWDFGSFLLATENLQIEQATQIKLRSNPDRPPENTTRASANSSQFSHGRGEMVLVREATGVEDQARGVSGPTQTICYFVSVRVTHTPKKLVIIVNNN